MKTLFLLTAGVIVGVGAVSLWGLDRPRPDHPTCNARKAELKSCYFHSVTEADVRLFHQDTSEHEAAKFSHPDIRIHVFSDLAEGTTPYVSWEETVIKGHLGYRNPEVHTSPQDLPRIVSGYGF
jgi:hypothetical protein